MASYQRRSSGVGVAVNVADVAQGHYPTSGGRSRREQTDNLKVKINKLLLHSKSVADQRRDRESNWFLIEG